MKNVALILFSFLILYSLIGSKIMAKEHAECMQNHFLLGKYSYRKHAAFVALSPPFSTRQIYLQTEVANAFKDMHLAAKKQGVDLVVLSGTRTFWQQKAIWEKKWKKYATLLPKERVEKIIKYSAIPGSSRHHWGTDIDLNSLNNDYFLTEQGTKIHQWLTKHAPSFGFYQVYDDKKHRTSGYEQEKWHWSYLPLAHDYLQQYNHCIQPQQIRDFVGDDTVKQWGQVFTYINGISQAAKKYTP